MNEINPGEKYEIIEQALQEAVGGGGTIDLCGFTCHILSKDLCDVDACRVKTPTSAL